MNLQHIESYGTGQINGKKPHPIVLTQHAAVNSHEFLSWRHGIGVQHMLPYGASHTKRVLRIQVRYCDSLYTLVCVQRVVFKLLIFVSFVLI